MRRKTFVRSVSIIISRFQNHTYTYTCTISGLLLVNLPQIIVQCIGEGGQGGVLRIDFSSDGEWIRGEARGKDENLATAPVVTILLAASSGEICEDKKVREEGALFLQLSFINLSTPWKTKCMLSRSIYSSWPLGLCLVRWRRPFYNDAKQAFVLSAGSLRNRGTGAVC